MLMAGIEPEIHERMDFALEVVSQVIFLVK